MKKVKSNPRFFRVLRILWLSKKFYFSNFGYALLLSLFVIYFIGAIHYDFVENDLKLEEVIYSNSLKEEVHKKIDIALETQDFRRLSEDAKPLKNKLMIMIQDYYNFKLYYDSHEKYKFIQAKKQLEFITKVVSGKKYEISIYSLQKKTWNSVYKHWLKYFNRSIKSSSKYFYLTVWLFCIYPISCLSIFAILNRKRIKK